MPIEIESNPLRTPWNKGRLVGQKRPLRPKEVWAIRVRLQIKHNKRDLAMFNLAIDSKLRGCDLVSLRVDDIAVGGHVRDRATIIQRKTGHPFTSKSRSRLAPRGRTGGTRDRQIGAPTSFRAESIINLMSQRANTRALCVAGSRGPG